MISQLTEYVDNWIRDNHVPFPRAGEPELTLMEEKALREEAERAVSPPSPVKLTNRQKRHRVVRKMNKLSWLLKRKIVYSRKRSSWMIHSTRNGD